MKRAFLFIIVLICFSYTEARENQFVNVRGYFEVIDGGYDDAHILIRSEYGGVKYGLLKSNGHFLLKLFKDHTYIIEFNKLGYIQKKVKIDTNFPSKIQNVKINFDVKLFPHLSKTNMFVYNHPIGSIRIISSKGIKVDFNYDATLVSSSKMTF